jgi:hypothetical protein
MSELKPCPLCGGSAKIYYPFHLIGKPSQAATYNGGVQCTSCGCSTKATTPPDKSIEAWNARAILASAGQAEPIYEQRIESRFEVSWRRVAKDRFDALPEDQRRIVYTAPTPAAAQDEREAFEACLAAGVFDDERVSDFCDCETEAAWRGFQAGRASLAASAGSVVDVSDGPGCVMHMPTADEIDKLRDEARRVSRAGVEWMRIEERAEVLANLADLALAGLAASAEQAECAYALIGRQLISSGLYDRMTDADSNDEAAGLISELVSVVDPILSTKYERHNAAPTPAAARDERGAFDLLLNEFAATQRELAIKGEACSMRVIEHSNKLRAQIMARAAASPGVSTALPRRPAVVMAYSTKGHNKPCGQTMGANGCGEFVKVYYGDIDTAEREARDHIARMAESGHRFNWALVMRSDEDSYHGPTMTLAEIERLDRAEGKS